MTTLLIAEDEFIIRLTIAEFLRERVLANGSPKAT